MSTIGSALRIVMGGAIAYIVLSPSDVNRPDSVSTQQSLINELAQRVGEQSKIIVRDEPYIPESKRIYASSSYCPWRGVAIVNLPKGSPLSDEEMKLVGLHELGHISERHTVIITTMIATNALLFGMPFIPHRTVLKCAGLSLLFSIPIFMIMENHADSFALHHATLDELKAIQAIEKQKKPPQPNGFTEYFMEKFVTRTTARRAQLEQAILTKSISSKKNSLR